jgi:hypothetical protein
MIGTHPLDMCAANMTDARPCGVVEGIRERPIAARPPLEGTPVMLVAPEILRRPARIVQRTTYEAVVVEAVESVGRVCHVARAKPTAPEMVRALECDAGDTDLSKDPSTLWKEFCQSSEV